MVECPEEKCYRTLTKGECKKPNSWLIFNRVHKKMFNRATSKIVYKNIFLKNLMERLGGNPTKKQLEKALCKFFKEYIEDSDKKLEYEVMLRSDLEEWIQEGGVIPIQQQIIRIASQNRPTKTSSSKKTSSKKTSSKKTSSKKASSKKASSSKTASRKATVVSARVTAARERVLQEAEDQVRQAIDNPPALLSLTEQERSVQFDQLPNDPAYTPKPHQHKVVEHMAKIDHNVTRGLLCAHQTGSGKSLTALWVAKKMLELGRVSYVNIVAPKVSMPEFARAKKTAGMTKQQAIKTRIVSHDEFRLNKSGRDWKDTLIIVDEVHLFTKKKLKALQVSGAKYLMLLSATPTPNSPYEIINLINILYPDSKAHKRWEPKDWVNATLSEKRAFTKNMVSVHGVNAEGIIDQIGRGKIPEANGYPSYTLREVSVPMKEAQTERYRRLLESRGGVDFFNDEIEIKPFFLPDRRIVDKYHTDLNDSLKVTPKIRKIAEDVIAELGKPYNQNRPHKTGGRLVVFARYMETIKDIKRALEALHERSGRNTDLTIEIYTGETSPKERKRIKKNFNEGKVEVLILSDAASVGLDLKCVSNFYVGDITWNSAKMNQVIARSIRYKSHSDDVCSHRHVDVLLYTSVKAPAAEDLTVFDAYILKRAIKRGNLIGNFIEDILKKSSIEQSDDPLAENNSRRPLNHTSSRKKSSSPTKKSSSSSSSSRSKSPTKKSSSSRSQPAGKKWDTILKGWESGEKIPSIKGSVFWETSAVKPGAQNRYKERQVDASAELPMSTNSDTSSFRQYISTSSPVAFDNLSGSARLVIPPDTGKNFAHIGAFYANATTLQAVEFWKLVASEVRKELAKPGVNKLYVSTHGQGVPWLHVRIEKTPRYYASELKNT